MDILGIAYRSIGYSQNIIGTLFKQYYYDVNG